MIILQLSVGHEAYFFHGQNVKNWYYKVFPFENNNKDNNEAPTGNFDKYTTNVEVGGKEKRITYFRNILWTNELINNF